MTLSETPLQATKQGPVQMSADAHGNLKKIMTESEGRILRLRVAGFG